MNYEACAFRSSTDWLQVSRMKIAALVKMNQFDKYFNVTTARLKIFEEIIMRNISHFKTDFLKKARDARAKKLIKGKQVILLYLSN